jgi:DHA2 family multidrug resistance protein-like MFS transporter
VANVALPDIGRHFDASQISLNLVAVGFSVGLAASVLWLGAIGDSHGRKTMLVLGTALSLPTALAAAWAPSIEFLIVARVVGGVAAGMAFPTTLSLITALWSGAPRTRSIALWSAFGGASAALGPLIAGAVLVSFWWGSVFLITAPLAVVALVGAIVLVPSGVDESHERIDHFGGVLSVVAVAGVVLGINFAPEGGLGTQAVIASIVGVAAVGAFLLRQRRAPVPLYDLSVARRRTFWVAAVAGILVFGSLMGAIFVGQQYLQNVLGYSTWTAGLSAVPAAVVMIVLAPHSAKMVERYGSRTTLMAGYALLFLGFLVMLFLWRSATSFALVCVGYAFLGAGVALAGTPASRALTSAVPVRRAGMASATADLQRDLGGAVMQSIFGALLTAGYIRAFDSRIDVTEQTQTISDQVAGQLTKSFSSAEATAAQFPQYASEITAAARESFVAGQRWSFLAGMAAMALGALVVRFGFPDREREIEMIAGYRRTDAADRLS